MEHLSPATHGALITCNTWSTYHVQHMEHLSPATHGALITCNTWSTYHVQHMERLSRATHGALITCNTWSAYHLQHLSPATYHLQPHGTKGQLSYWIRHSCNCIDFSIILLAEALNWWRRGGNWSTDLLTYAHCSRWSIGHQRPVAIALCSGLLWSFRTSWSPAVSALLQYLASNCCEAGLSFSSPAGSRSGLGVWCWMLASWGCVRSSPTSSAVSAWPLVPVPLAPTDLHFGSSLAIGFCRCASDRCWRMSGSFVVLSTMSHIRTAGLTSHWSWRCGEKPQWRSSENARYYSLKIKPQARLKPVQ